MRNIHSVVHKFSCIKQISKAFTLFCRKFGNVVNRAFLVLVFWAKTAAGAIFFAFCNYVKTLSVLPTLVLAPCMQSLPTKYSPFICIRILITTKVILVLVLKCRLPPQMHAAQAGEVGPGYWLHTKQALAFPPAHFLQLSMARAPLLTCSWLLENLSFCPDLMDWKVLFPPFPTE